jgi:hypothetical protein
VHQALRSVITSEWLEWHQGLLFTQWNNTICSHDTFKVPNGFQAWRYNSESQVSGFSNYRMTYFWITSVAG